MTVTTETAIRDLFTQGITLQAIEGTPNSPETTLSGAGMRQRLFNTWRQVSTLRARVAVAERKSWFYPHRIGRHSPYLWRRGTDLGPCLEGRLASIVEPPIMEWQDDQQASIVRRFGLTVRGGDGRLSMVLLQDVDVEKTELLDEPLDYSDLGGLS